MERRKSAVPDEEIAARLAPLGMRAAVPRVNLPEADRVVLLPSESLLDNVGAARALARIPKPVECFAHVRDLILQVQCVTITDPAKLQLVQHISGGSPSGSVLLAAVRRAASRAPMPIVQVDGTGESVLATPESVELWLRDYLIGGVGLGGREPDERESSRGVVYVIVVSGIDDL
jgi:hypothetical protein